MIPWCFQKNFYPKKSQCDFLGSYARGCAVHNSFNRATTIHGVTDLLIERNVMFDIKGLSFFIEDGIEEDNILQYNLAIYTKQSSRYDH